jgi:hypothetical protein
MIGWSIIGCAVGLYIAAYIADRKERRGKQ